MTIQLDITLPISIFFHLPTKISHDSFVAQNMQIFVLKFKIKQAVDCLFDRSSFNFQFLLQEIVVSGYSKMALNELNGSLFVAFRLV